MVAKKYVGKFRLLLFLCVLNKDFMGEFNSPTRISNLSVSFLFLQPRSNARNSNHPRYYAVYRDVSSSIFILSSPVDCLAYFTREGDTSSSAKRSKSNGQH